jgi:GTPase SAR1 family protein
MRITIIGLANVGKTTIIKHTFEGYSLEDIKKIRPTILKEQSTVVPSWIHDQINILDLGGQESFLDAHTNKENFQDQDLVIFVVDIINIDNINLEYDYFSKIIEIINALPRKPLVALFFHKFDPKLRPDLQNNLALHMQICTNIFDKIEYKMSITSIYDKTLLNAMIELLIQLSQQEIISLGLYRLQPSVWALVGLNSEEESIQYLKIIGTRFSQEVKDQWLEVILHGRSIDDFEGGGNFDYSLKKVNNQMKIEIPLENCPSNQFCSSKTIMETFFKAFLSSLNLELQTKDNNTSIELIIEPRLVTV